MRLTETQLKVVLVDILPAINEDESVLEYFVGMLMDNSSIYDESYLQENVAPFIESYGLNSSDLSIDDICKQLCHSLKVISGNETDRTSSQDDDTPKLLDKAVILSEVAKNQISASEQETIDTLWGFQKIRAKRNDTFEATEAASSKYERKAQKEQKKFLDSLDAKISNGESDKRDNLEDGDEDGNGQISAMILPDLTSKSREKDIHVSNFNVTFGGQILLEGADLKIVYGRRYGLVGRNGIGKTTLLKHMASFDIEGFPTHHRVLHVKQEVYSTGKTVLQAVLDSDVERNQLIEKEKKLLEEQQSSDNATRLQEISTELTEVYERMEYIGAQSAESRAAQILSGLQFTEDMQKGSTEALSGGWRMRVSLASALFIEPDLLMLDE